MLGLKSVLADLLPALSAAANVSVFSGEESSEADRPVAPTLHTRTAITQERRKSIQVSVPVIPEGEAGNLCAADGEAPAEVSRTHLETDVASPSAVVTATLGARVGSASNMVAQATAPQSALRQLTTSGLRNRRASYGALPSKSPPFASTTAFAGAPPSLLPCSSSFSAATDNSDSAASTPHDRFMTRTDAGVPSATAGLPPLPRGGPQARTRRRSSLLNYIATGRRASESSAASATELGVNQPPPLVPDDGTSTPHESHSTGAVAISDFINQGGMTELVDAAMVGLLRVVSRFQALYEEGSQARSVSRQSPQEDGFVRKSSSFAMGNDLMQNGASLLTSVQESARAGRRMSTFSRTFSTASEDAGEDKVLQSDGDAAKIEPQSVSVQLTREDLDALTSLADVLTVAWSGGFFMPPATPQGNPSGPAQYQQSEAEATEAGLHRDDSHNTSPLINHSTSGHNSRRSSHSDLDAAFSSLGVQPHVPFTIGAVGGLLRRASAAFTPDQSVLTMFNSSSSSHRNIPASVGFSAIPESSAPGQDGEHLFRKNSSGSVLSTGGRDNSRPASPEEGLGATGLQIPDSPIASVQRATAATPVQGSASHTRHRSARHMAKEELERSFMANPQIFDESTREYVAALVSPEATPRPKTAKDRLRAGVAKVVRVAALAKRLSTFTTSKAPLVEVEETKPVSKDGPVVKDAGIASLLSPTAVTQASGDLDAKRRSTSKLDPLLRYLTTLDVSALAGMDKWDFDIIEANQKLLSSANLKPVATEVASSMSPESATVTSTSSATSFRPKSIRATSIHAGVEALHHVITQTEPHAAATAIRAEFGDSRTSADGAAAEMNESTTSSSKFTDIPDAGNGIGTEMLVVLVSNGLEHLNVIDDLSLDRDTLLSFLSRIARSYHNQPYHNALHGADVSQAMFYLLTTGGLAPKLTPEYRLAALLAAAVHDVGHPGLNNIYLAQTQHPLALTYNDRSPLENMHAATAFLTMRKSGCDVLAPLTVEQRNDIRSTMIDMILATDNAHHFKLIGKIQRRLARAMRDTAGEEDYTSSDDGLDHSEEEISAVVTHPIDCKKLSDARLVLQTTLHACDISNPARRWNPYSKWTDRITEEFLNQGDKLREHGLAVPPMHDRSKHIPRPNMQAGFITALVLPLWNCLMEPAFKQLLDASEIVSGLKTNLGTYTDMIEKAKAAQAAETKP